MPYPENYVQNAAVYRKIPRFAVSNRKVRWVISQCQDWEIGRWLIRMVRRNGVEHGGDTVHFRVSIGVVERVMQTTAFFA